MFSQCISMVLMACCYPALQRTYACARQQTALFFSNTSIIYVLQIQSNALVIPTPAFLCAHFIMRS